MTNLNCIILQEIALDVIDIKQQSVSNLTSLLHVCRKLKRIHYLYV